MYSSTVYPTAGEVNQAMGRVYAYMGLATLVSMLVSWFVGSDPALMQFFFTGWMMWVTILAPLAAIFLVIPMIGSNPPKAVALAVLCGFAALMGLSLSTVFAVYVMSSIVSAFAGAAVLFGVMAFYGYFTKRDLDSVGKWAFIALIAIIIVSLINLFVGSTVMQMAISAIAVLVFMALTAYDVQTIRDQVMSGASDNSVEVMGALTLYLDFINLFINLLQLFGVKKD